MAFRAVDVMQLLLQTSRELLENVYLACKGLSAKHQKTSQMFLSTYHEIEARLLKAWPESPCTINLEKMDQLGSEVLHREAYVMLHEIEPLYKLIKEMSDFKSRLTAFLQEHGNITSALTVQYTPGLLSQFIELTGNTVRMHLLARHMPYKQIIQLYNLVYATVEMQESQRIATPPDMRAVISYAQAFPRILTLLQSEFQAVSSCIGQVLEAVVCTAVLAYGDSSALRASGLLNVSARASPCAAAAESSTDETGWAVVEWLPRLREWALLAFLICPGEVIRPGTRQVLHIVLRDTLRMQVYKTHCEWVHPLFEAHVRPTLVTFYNSTKSSLERPDRKGLERTVKRLVEESLKEALSGCVVEHRKRRLLLTDALQRMSIRMDMQPSDVADRIEAVLAVLSCARAEVEWWFQHWGEVVPKGVFQSLLSNADPLRALSPEDRLPALISAMNTAEQHLQGHRAGIAWQAAAGLQEALDSCPLNLGPHMSSSFTAELRIILSTLQALHNSPQLSRESAEANVHASWSPYPTEPDLEAARASCERLYCETIFPAASTSGAPTWAAEAAQPDGSPLSSLCALLQKTRLIDSLNTSIERAASLHQLSYYYDKGDFRQLKMRAAMLATLDLPYRDIERCLAWLHALSWLGAAPDQDTSDSCAAAAGALATQLMYGVAEAFRRLVTDAHRTMSEMPGFVLPRARAADTAGEGAKQGRGQRLLRDIRNKMDVKEDVRNGQEEDSIAHLNLLLLAAKKLTAALAKSAAFEIHKDLIVEPAAHLVAAARATFQCLLSSFTFPGKDLARPMLIERAVHRLLDIYSALQEASGCDLVGVAREVLAGNASSPLPQQPVDPDSGERLLMFVGEWFAQTILMDSTNMGVSFSLSRQSFYSSRGSAPAEYASEAELRALVRTFGLYGARELGACTERSLADAVSGLHAMLASNEELFSQLGAEYKVHGSCLEACAAAAAGFADLHAVTDRCRLLARCLFLRRLIADAAASEAAALLPAASASLEAAALAAAGCRGPHICDLLDLPRSSFSAAAPGAAADPLLVRLIAESGSRLWRNWPLLLALTLWIPVWASAAYSPKYAALVNDMDYLAVIVPDLALAAAAAEAQEGNMDQEGASTAAEAVGCFMQCASGALAAREDSFSSKASALSRAASVAYMRGLVDADEALQACHLANCGEGRASGQHAPSLAASA